MPIFFQQKLFEHMMEHFVQTTIIACEQTFYLLPIQQPVDLDLTLWVGSFFSVPNIWINLETHT